MKKILIAVLLIIPFVYALSGEKNLSVKELHSKFGKQEFESEKFKSGDEKIRASMTGSLLVRKKEFLGKSLDEVKSIFGEPDGFYRQADIFPAYLIFRSQNPKENSWQILFQLDSNLRVKDIKVVEN